MCSTIVGARARKTIGNWRDPKAAVGIPAARVTSIGASSIGPPYQRGAEMERGQQGRGTTVGISKRGAAGRAAVGKLVETFPAAFAFIERKPLKLGIHDDLLARGIAPDVIKPGLGAYCRGGRYLRSLQAEAIRIDLDGKPAGVITAEDAEHAVRKLAELDARG
jgi:hypothetical protein